VKYVRHLMLSILGDEMTKPYGLDNLEDVFSPIANLYSKYNDIMIEHTPDILQKCYQLLEKDH